jgi:hypothetical protein
MKKTLLSLLAVIGISVAASAEVATFIAPKFTDQEGTKLINADESTSSGSNTDETMSLVGQSFTNGDITISFAKGSSSNYYSGAYDTEVRWYQGATMTVSAPDDYNITKIFVQTVKSSKGNFTATDANGSEIGTVEGEGTSATAPITWTGTASGAITLTANKAIRFSYIEVTYSAAGEEFLAAPTFSVSAGTYYEAQTVEISQSEADDIYYTIDGTEPTTASTVYTGAITVSETTTIKAIAISGNLTSDVASATYTIVYPTEVKTIAEAIAAEDGAVVNVNFPLTVAYVNGGNIFATDAAGDFIQVFIYNSGLKANDVIPAGWIAKYTLYSNYTPELVPVGTTLPESTETAEFTAAAVDPTSISTDMVNSVVVIKGVSFTEATPDTKTNFTGTVGETELTFRNNYTIDSVEAGTYDVTVVVNVYSSNVQLYPISYSVSGESGINTVSAAATATTAEVYNLQGIRVANPTRGGIYIINGQKIRL